MHLNHLHYSVPDVQATASFFIDHFDFRLLEVRGRAGLAILKGEQDVILVLMAARQNALQQAEPYGDLHIGFLVDDEATVRRTHQRLHAAGHQPSALQIMRGSLGFYCRAPGGMLVEVGHRPSA